VEAAERVGKPQQADGSGQEKEGAGADSNNSQTIKQKPHAPPVRDCAIPKTKAIETKAASSPKVSATSTAAGEIHRLRQQ
jgi:hypothetical protein